MGAIYSGEVSERILALNRDSLQDGRPNSYCTEPLPYSTLAHSSNGLPVPRAAAQQPSFGPFSIPNTNYHVDTVREPTIDSTEGEDINENGMMNTPYRPYPATYSFDGSPPLGFNNQIEQCYEYGRPYGPSFTHASSYGHQPVEQHYDNSLGGQEHQGHVGPVEYRASSYKRMTR